MSFMRKANENTLLDILGPDDRAALLEQSEPVFLRSKQVLAAPSMLATTLYFINTGIVSQITVSARGHRVEAGMYGREGVGPPELLFGPYRTPHEHVMQSDGSARSIDGTRLRGLIESNGAIRQAILGFVLSFAIQTAYATLSSCHSTIPQRVARRILMCHDRIDGDEFPVTHGFLATTLGVRRAGVTEAMHILEGERLVRAGRGAIQVLNRPGLEAMADDIYGVPELEYRRLLGHRSDRSAARDTA